MDWINSVRTPTRGKMRMQKTSRKPLKKKKNKLQNERRYLQMMQPTRD